MRRAAALVPVGPSLALLCLTSCTRPRPAPIVDASVGDASVSVDASAASDASAVVDAGAKRAVTVDAYCNELVARTSSPEGFTCYGETVQPTCIAKTVKKMPALGAVVQIDEKEPDGTRTSLALANAEGKFAILVSVPTQACVTGDRSVITLGLVSAVEDADAGATMATLVIDSLQVDAPYQGGAPFVTARRSRIRCRTKDGAPACDPPETMGTFEGSSPTYAAPPFAQWKKK